MKKKSTIVNFCLVAGAVATVTTPSAHAAEASDFLVFSKGPVSLRPQLELVEQFTDNVYYQSQDRVSDFVTILSPGLRIVAGQDLPTENHFIINYNLDQLLYASETRQNAMQHRISTDSRYQWTKLSFEGTDRIDFLASAIGGGLTQPTRDPIDRLVIVDNYRVDYQWGQRMSSYIEAAHSSVDYEEGLQLFDSRTLTGTGGFEYLYTADTRFFGEVYYGVTDLEDNFNPANDLPGRDFVGGFVGARGNFTQKLRGRVKAGYEVSSFSGGSAASAGLDKSAGEAPVVEANLAYQFTDRSNLSLTYSRRQFVSVQFTRSAYTSDNITLAASQILGSVGRLRLNGAVTYQNLAYEPTATIPSRSDSSISFVTAASWFFETWLSTRLQYSYESYSSDLPSVVDYHVNRITLSLAIGY